MDKDKFVVQSLVRRFLKKWNIYIRWIWNTKVYGTQYGYKKLDYAYFTSFFE